MGISREEAREIGRAIAEEILTSVARQREAVELRDLIIGSAMGEGAIPLHGRETKKAPCYGCRIDLTKPLESGNVMATTEGAIGTLSADEVRDWCSEILEAPDGRCTRVRAIREAAGKCREAHPGDTRAFFQCYAPAWAAITRRD